MKTYTITLLLCLLCFVPKAQEFELDSTFGDGGIVVTKTNFNSSIYEVAQSSDGRVFATGYSFNSYNQLCAYLPDGSLDTTFGNKGFINSTLLDEESPLTMLVQPDGKIVVAGYHQINPEPPNEYHSYLIRYLPNGILDSTFGESGIVRIQTESSNDGITSNCCKPMVR